MPAVVQWGLTLALVLVAGMLFAGGRENMLPVLQGWATPAAPEPPPVTVEDPPPEATEPPPPEEPAEEPWTYSRAEEALQPLPEDTDTLIASGRAELRDLARVNETLFDNRWETWSRTWLNRIRVIRQAMPPAELCQQHVGLTQDCAVMVDALTTLAQAPATGSVRQARPLLDRAEEVLEAWRQAKADAEAAALLEAEEALEGTTDEDTGATEATPVP